ncbi:DUF1015 domain-containing protein [Thermodesulforhabdus norvegica]|uniref:Uncharacterized conserved protein, DUF1015 family n=1 Tax=Thermodesulforhabdus norvegica TaxID=39841 RepID=A0A1I4TG17_9BACT|nr:DUF1015 domain-containing protein [Thermodesulforhabdus norvegica]SFM75629.1 Uncharacterized conserved protein, DUF1015 family [Thermodesulforhabdus norvegica]
MACIAPLRGIRYNEKVIDRWENIITPPYDVISPQEREDFRKRSEYNFVHLDLPRDLGESTDGDAPYRKAADLYKKWLNSGILIQDLEPCFYYYELDFTLPHDAALHTRKGFICLLKLEEFFSGYVYPHERTFSRVKEDRLKLMQYCKAQFSPVFALYSDPDDYVTDLFEASEKGEPLVRFRDVQGMNHRIWKLSDPGVLKRIGEFFRDRDIFIADGHHRYETALAYRDLKRSELRNHNDPTMPHEYCLMYLSAMENPGLTILPTHRMFVSFPVERWDYFLEKAGEFFEVEKVDCTDEGLEVVRQGLKEALADSRTAFGCACRDRGSLALLMGRTESIFAYLRDSGVAPCFYDVDVVILDRLVFGELLELPVSLLEDERVLHFCRDIDEAFKSLQDGSYSAGFFINPTRIEQVCRVAKSGYTMPHKATYFHPKVVSGLVLFSMDESEKIAGFN